MPGGRVTGRRNERCFRQPRRRIRSSRKCGRFPRQSPVQSRRGGNREGSLSAESPPFLQGCVSPAFPAAYRVSPPPPCPARGEPPCCHGDQTPSRVRPHPGCQVDGRGWQSRVIHREKVDVQKRNTCRVCKGAKGSSPAFPPCVWGRFRPPDRKPPGSLRRIPGNIISERRERPRIHAVHHVRPLHRGIQGAPDMHCDGNG